MAPAMTQKDPSGPIISAAFTLDTTHGAHPCLSCRKYEIAGWVPQCSTGAHWFMRKMLRWECTGFEREPGDQ